LDYPANECHLDTTGGGHQRNLIAKASIADIAADVENDRQEQLSKKLAR
jgi:hypothetical protein